MRNPLLKLFHKLVAAECQGGARGVPEPVQLGLSKSGAEKLVFSVRTLLEVRRDFICIKMDL